MSYSARRARVVDGVRNYFCKEWSEAVLLSSEFVPPFVRRHLKKVYLLLYCASASAAVGCFLGPSFRVVSAAFELFMCLMSFTATFISFLCLSALPPLMEDRRFYLFILGAFFGGASLGSALSQSYNDQIGIVVTVLLATSVGFICFWAVAKWTESFNAIFFFSLIFCFPMVLACSFLTSVLFGGKTANRQYMLSLYAAVMFFMVYVATYSLEMAVRARRVESNFVGDALHLFFDFPYAVTNVPRFLTHIWRIRNLLFTSPPSPTPSPPSC